MGQKKVYYLCSEVSQFQRLKELVFYLERCPQFKGVHIEARGFHCRIFYR